MIPRLLSKTRFIEVCKRNRFYSSSCESENKSGLAIEKKVMEDIRDVWLGPLPEDSIYLKPYRLHYTQNGRQKNWDLLKAHDSVSIIIYNVEREKLIFVRQFRPAVLFGILTPSSTPKEIATNSAKEQKNVIDMSTVSVKNAITLELCAGLVDKPVSLRQVAMEEVLEECGYKVPVDSLEEIITYRSGVGTQGSQQTMYYCEVTDKDRVSAGGGVGDEIVEVVEYSIEEARKLVEKGSVTSSPPSCLMGIMWFLLNKCNDKKN